MKEVTFDQSPALDLKQQRIADLHSIFNVLNVLVGELSLTSMALDEARAAPFVSLEGEIASIAQEMRELDDMSHALTRVRASEVSVRAAFHALLSELTDAIDLEEARSSLSNIESVYGIVRQRLDELEARAEDPDIWVSIAPSHFEQQLREVFYAIEKNAKGRYRIFFNLARKDSGDYYIDLRVESALDSEVLRVPLRLIDVIRDLTANARKYTEPGGKVALAIYQTSDEIQVLVQDSGCGIPADEIERVVEFGYRATNVRERPTMGGGFGLTKAAWLAQHWGGCLAIASEEGVGTVVRMNIPNQVCEDCTEHAANYSI
ncbi:sensor histidine kinase [Coraliomargarita sp. W4R53]